MRPDMAKVIVERPRPGSCARGPGKGEKRRAQRLGLEELPRREGIQGHCRANPKSLNEHLGPLRRYLDRQAGRPWDAVFSEICAHINRASAVQDHVRDHVDDYVVTNVVLLDGVPCYAGPARWRGRYGEPIVRRRWGPRLYVCPRTRLLRRAPLCREDTKRARTARLARPALLPTTWVDDRHFAHRTESGQWRLVEVRPLPDGSAHDTFLGRWVTACEARSCYGRAVCAVGWRFMGNRERKRLKLE
jgi:hypothetical protein